MINRELINPQSIVVVGGSNNVHKPGGRIVRNLLDGKYKGLVYFTSVMVGTQNSCMVLSGLRRNYCICRYSPYLPEV